MDVTAILETSAEPETTMLLQQWMSAVRQRMSTEQTAAMESYFHEARFDAAAQRVLRRDQHDVATLTQLAERLDHRSDAESLARVTSILAAARERPAQASALAWHFLGRHTPVLASNIIHAIRERASLPGLRERLTSGDGAAWFADLQAADAAAWAERIPPQHATTLVETTARNETHRTLSTSEVDDVHVFLQQVARFLLTASTRQRDPLGFPIAREGQLECELSLARRIEISAWARGGLRTLCLRGRSIVLSIAVDAPWPLQLEVVAAELGCGFSGAVGLAMRLRGDDVPGFSTELPVFLLVPHEALAARGARFERWIGPAYAHAVGAWRTLA